MVPPACDARLVGLILAVFTGATCASARNGFAEPRDREPKSTLSRSRPAAETASLPFEPAKMPANSGLFGRDATTKDAAMGHFRLAGQERRACDVGSTVGTS